MQEHCSPERISGNALPAVPFLRRNPAEADSAALSFHQFLNERRNSMDLNMQQTLAVTIVLVGTVVLSLFLFRK